MILLLKHHCLRDLLVTLVCHEDMIIPQLLQLLSLFRQHVCKCQLLISLHLRRFQEVFMLELPFGRILSEQLLFPLQEG